MWIVKKWKVWRHMIFTPPPLTQTVTLSQTPSPPLEHDILYGRPLSSKNRKSWNGRQMVWQCTPNIWSNRWKWFGSCHGGFTWRNAYWERWRREECLCRHISRDERWKIGWLLRLEHSESNRGNFLWWTGSQCKSEKTGLMWQNWGFCTTTRVRVFWTRWRQVRFETDVPARGELQKSSRESTIAAAMVLEASAVREARMWHRARIWKYTATSL